MDLLLNTIFQGADLCSAYLPGVRVGKFYRVVESKNATIIFAECRKSGKVIRRRCFEGRSDSFTNGLQSYKLTGCGLRYIGRC